MGDRRGKYPQSVAGGGRINNKENSSLAALGESKREKYRETEAGIQLSV